MTKSIPLWSSISYRRGNKVCFTYLLLNTGVVDCRQNLISSCCQSRAGSISETNLISSEACQVGMYTLVEYQMLPLVTTSQFFDPFLMTIVPIQTHFTSTTSPNYVGAFLNCMTVFISQTQIPQIIRVSICSNTGSTFCCH